ncbi:MAG: flagellar basal body P-ring protein FlgI [Gammaproteobacteria bacterium]|nr:flagellar basal body P-ring protein FlgI [Gammaproteobacteria bacterium]MCK5091572.1 flagellar basal body P-ring protein FlgI [Gammaproteobacteria bacterium]
MKLIRIFLGFILMVLTCYVQAERIKDLASIAGVRSNQLLGYGLVVGLDGTGGKTAFSAQSLRNMLNRYGITLPPNVNPQSKNIAAVSVHADLPAFAKLGQNIDITVSSLGDAKSLRGGSLLMTPLKGADGKIYALAQGNLVVGGLGVSGNDGSRLSINVPSVGRIPNGASVEREVPNPFANGDNITLNLHTADFTTVSRLVQAINYKIGLGTARAVDAMSVWVNAPKVVAQRVAYVSMLENIEIAPGEAPARVVVNSRTGTVIIGNHVRVMPAAVTHGSMVVTITERTTVSQPSPLSTGGATAIVPTTDIEVEQEDSRMFLFNPGVRLDEIVRAVNEVGAAPGDLVAILEALKRAGALRAELVVI